MCGRDVSRLISSQEEIVIKHLQGEPGIVLGECFSQKPDFILNKQKKKKVMILLLGEERECLVWVHCFGVWITAIAG